MLTPALFRSGVEYCEGVTYDALDSVQGGVRATHELVGIDLVDYWAKGHAQTRSHGELLIEMPDGFCDRCHDPLHDLQTSGLIIELLKPDQELVATPPDDRVMRAHSRSYSVRPPPAVS
jgi:hypothetical protein